MVTLIFVFLEWNLDHKPYSIFLWVLWTVGPPGWFVLEYWAVGPRPSTSPEVKNRFEEFKYSQDLAAKLWLGIVAALGAYILGHPH